MAGRKGRQKEFAHWPKYKGLYIRAFDRMLIELDRLGKRREPWGIGTTGEDVYHWWIEDSVLPGQMSLDGSGDDIET